MGGGNTVTDAYASAMAAIGVRVQGATTAAERRLVATLGRLPVAAQHAGIGSPAVLIVGNVLHGVAALAHSAPAEPAPPIRGPRSHCGDLATGTP